MPRLSRKPSECISFLLHMGPLLTSNHSRKAVLTAHPDKGGSEAKMATVNEAYEVLSKPGKHICYSCTNPSRICFHFLLQNSASASTTAMTRTTRTHKEVTPLAVASTRLHNSSRVVEEVSRSGMDIDRARHVLPDANNNTPWTPDYDCGLKSLYAYVIIFALRRTHSASAVSQAVVKDRPTISCQR
jgi:hypothetical protein